MEKTPEKERKPLKVSSQDDSGRGFVGLFSGLDLPNLIQLLAMNNFSGRVEIRHKEKSGELFFQGGEVVHASGESMEGVEAVERMLTWPEGEVRLEGGFPSPKSTIDIPWHALLIQAMARLEDKEAGTQAKEEESPKGARSPAEVMRARFLHSSVVKLDGVRSCLIGEKETGDLLCPSQGPAKIEEFFSQAAKLYKMCEEIGLEVSGGPPKMLLLGMETGSWGLVKLEHYLVGVELEKGTVLEELEKRLRRIWEKRE